MEHPASDIARELALLHTLNGADYARQVERIALRREFHLLEGETCIYACGGVSGKDFRDQLAAARKAVAHGYTAFLLPNPHGGRTPDLILRHRNIYKIYELKTISGKTTADNRLRDSIGQSNRVLLHILNDYNTGMLATAIRHYFASNPQAIEVLIYKRNKQIVVTRADAASSGFQKVFRRLYEK